MTNVETQPLETTEPHISKTCDEHPHCPFCGAPLDDNGEPLVCCGTEVEVAL